MKKIYLLSAFFIISCVLNAQSIREYNNPDYQSFQKANKIIKEIFQTPYGNIDGLKYILTGIRHYEGHFPVPGQRVPMPITTKVSAERNNSYYMESEFVFWEDTLYRQECFTPDSAYIRYYGEKEKTSRYKLRKESYLPYYNPVSVLWDMFENKNSLRYLGEEGTYTILSYTSSFNKQATVVIDTDSKTIHSVSFLLYNDIQGDYYRCFHYQNYFLKEGILIPERLEITEGDSLSQEFTYTYKEITTKPQSDEFNGYTLETIGRNIYAIAYPTHKHRSFVIDFGSYLGIIEIPMNEIYAQTINRFIKKHFPDKTVKYAFLTHHHPDHAGGFAYFYNNGASVVTTEISKAYQQDLLKRKHQLRKTTVEQSTTGDFIVVPSKGKQDFSSSSVKMTAYEFGNNGHTEEFILYYFPQSRILIVGDLFYTPNTYIRANSRAEMITRFIKDNKLKVEKLYQTWSPLDYKPYSTPDDLRKSAELYLQSNEGR